MENENNKFKRNKYSKSKQYNLEGFQQNVDIRKKNLTILNLKLRHSLSKMNTLLSKINNVKNLVVFKKYDINDLNSIKNLDKNALCFSKEIKQEIKNSSDLLYAYNLGPIDLDNFMNNMEKQKKTHKIKYDREKNYNINEIYNKFKKEFDLANVGKSKKEKNINNIFLKNESKLRNLYNLKLDLFFREQRKKIGKNTYFEITKKPRMYIREKDKNINNQYSAVKSKYYDMYKLSNSFEIEEGKGEKELYEEENKEEDNINNINNKVNSDEIFVTKKYKIINQKKCEKNYLKYYNNQNISNNTNNHYINKNYKENEQEDKKENIIFKINNDYKIDNDDSNINKKMRKSFTPNKNNNNLIKSSFYINKSSSNIYTTRNKDNKSKYIIRLKTKNDKDKQNNFIINNSNYTKIFINNYSSKAKRNRQISPDLSSKQTFYSSNSSNRPKSNFSNINNTICLFNNNNSYRNIQFNNSIKNLNSKYKKNSNFNNYINEINKIIEYSNYETNKLKKSSKELNKKKLFHKSNSEIYERTYNIDIKKIKEDLKLDKNPHSFIEEKKLLLDNAKKVKFMLTEKHRVLLNSIIMELLARERIANNFFYDISKSDKIKIKYLRNKKISKIAAETMIYEKKLDKESIYEIFEPDEEKIMDYLKEINNRELDEEDLKFILLKYKNLKQIDKTNKKKFIKGNLHKKHLFYKYKKIKD